MHVIHTHKDCAEIFLCIQGSAVHYINGKKQNLVPGSLTFVRPDDVHGYVEPISDDCQFLNILFDQHVMDDVIAYLGDSNMCKKLLSSEVSPNVFIPHIEYPLVKNKMEKLLFLPEFNAKMTRFMFRVFLVNILTDYFLVPKFDINTSTPTWIQTVINELHRPENYVAGVQAIYNISCRCPEHVCREFKKHLDKTPTQVVNEIRLEKAVWQLVYTSNKVIDISHLVGFENLSHFHHQFKKLYSLSPQQFRKKVTCLEIK
jgi:AraC family cel operon transcriptional repressor